MRRSRRHRGRRDDTGGIAHEHLRLSTGEGGTIDGPLLAIEVRESLIRGKPGAHAVDAFHLIEEIAGQAAVLIEEVAPVAAVVAADAEVSAGPENPVHITDRGGDLVDQ